MPKYYYGYCNDNLIGKMTDEVCRAFGDTEKTKRLLLETIGQETIFGRVKDFTNFSGMGLCQFDRIAFDDIKEHSTEYFQLIMDEWGIDFELVEYTHLRYNPFLSIISMRLKYKRVPESIPDTLHERYKYYKKYYNSSKGAANEEEYLTHAKRVDLIIA